MFKIYLCLEDVHPTPPSGVFRVFYPFTLVFPLRSVKYFTFRDTRPPSGSCTNQLVTAVSAPTGGSHPTGYTSNIDLYPLVLGPTLCTVLLILHPHPSVYQFTFDSLLGTLPIVHAVLNITCRGLPRRRFVLEGISSLGI